MLRQVLSASASIALLAGLTACGEDQAGSAPSPSDSGTVSASPRRPARLHISGGYDFKGERASFEPARTALKNITDKLFPALEGGDTQAIQTWVDAHAKPGGGAITYLDGRRIIQRVYSPPESDKALIQVFIANEKVGLDEEEG